MPPVIDGKLNDPCWKDACRAVGFMLLPVENEPVLAKDQTTVLAVYDQENLYFGVTCQEPHPDRIRPSTKSPWDADDVEIFLDTNNDQQTYYQFCIAARGVNTVMRQCKPVGMPIEVDYKLAREVSGDSWSFELAIPWKQLNRAPPGRLEKWGFNAGRVQFTGDQRVLSTWARVAMFNRVNQFGQLIFEPYNWRKDINDLRVVEDKSHYYQIASKRPDRVSGYNAAIEALGQVGLVLDGNTFVLVPDSESLNDVRSGLTVEAWVFGSSGANQGTLVSKYVWPLTGGFRLALSNGQIYAYLRGPGDGRTIVSQQKVLRMGRWNQIVMTWNGQRIRLFWNGKEDKNAYAGGTGKTPDYQVFAPLARPLAIGAALNKDDQPARLLKGLISHVRVYGRALTADQVARHYDQPDIKDVAALRAYWKLDRAKEGIVSDLSGNGNHGRIIGLAKDAEPVFKRSIASGTPLGKLLKYEPGTFKWDRNRTIRLSLLLGAQPDFSKIPTLYNQLVIALDFFADHLGTFQRVLAYARNTRTDIRQAEKTLVALTKQLEQFNAQLDEIYNIYGKIYLDNIGNVLPMEYKENRKTVLENTQVVAQVRQAIAAATQAFAQAGFAKRIAALNTQIDQANREIDRTIGALQQSLETQYHWQKYCVEIPAIGDDAKPDGWFRRFILKIKTQLNRLRKAPDQEHARSEDGVDRPARTETPPDFKPDGRSNRFHYNIAMYLQYPKLAGILGVYDVAGVGWKVYETDSPGKYDFTGHARELEKKYMKGAKKSWLLVPSALHGRFFLPKWFVNKHKDEDIFLTSQNGKMNRERTYYGAAYANYRNPKFRAMFLDFIRQLAEHYRHDDRFLFYMLGWEDYWTLRVDGKTRLPGYSPSARAMFQAHLQDKYKTIANLNRQWKTGYAGFDAIEPPDDPNIKPLPHATPLWYEFQNFRLDSYTKWLADIYRTVKQADPTKPVLHDDSMYMRNMQGFWKFDNKCADIYSFHSGDYDMMLVYMNSMKRHYGCGLANMESNWSYYAYDKNDERITRAAVKRYVYELAMRGVYTQPWWSAVASGVAYSIHCVWFNPRYDFTTLRYGLSAIPVARAKLQMVESAVLNSTIIQPRIALLEPTTTVINIFATPHPVISEMLTCHRRLFAPETNYHYEFLPEALIIRDANKLKGYDVVVLPYAIYFPPGLSDVLETFVRNGGTLVAIGPFGVYDQFGFEDGTLMRKLVGQVHGEGKTDVRQWKLQGNDDDVQLVVKPFGKGKVIFMNRSLARTMSMKKAELDKLLADATSRRAWCLDNKFALLVREDKSGVRYLCALNTDLESCAEDTVVVEGRYVMPIDIWIKGQFPVPAVTHAEGKTRFRLVLPPAGMTMIKLGKP